MPIYRGVANVTRQLSQVYRGVGGVNREIRRQFINADGAIRAVHEVGGASMKDQIVKYNGATSGFTHYAPTQLINSDWRLNTYSAASAAAPQISVAQTYYSIQVSSSRKMFLSVIFRNGFQVSKNTRLQVYGARARDEISATDDILLLDVVAGNYPVNTPAVFELNTEAGNGNYLYIQIRLVDRAGQYSGTVDITGLTRLS